MQFSNLHFMMRNLSKIKSLTRILTLQLGDKSKKTIETSYFNVCRLNDTCFETIFLNL